VLEITGVGGVGACRSCVSLGTQVCAACSMLGFLAVVATSVVTGSFKVGWDNDNNKGKMLKDDLL